MTMPDQGKVGSRDYAADESPASEIWPQPGPSTCDVFLKDTARRIAALYSLEARAEASKRVWFPGGKPLREYGRASVPAF